MSQNNSDQGQALEPPAQETRTFIRQVRAATRRKYAPEDKIRIVLEGFLRELTVIRVLCKCIFGQFPYPRLNSGDPDSGRCPFRRYVFPSTYFPDELIIETLDAQIYYLRTPD